jgi:hypothetical protein
MWLVNSWRRRLVRSCSCLNGALFFLSQTGQSAEPDLSLEIPKWDKSINLRAAAGYKDNLTLGNVRTEASPFSSAGLDLMIWRLPIDGPQFNFFITGDDVRYFEGATVDHEDTLIAQAQVKFDLGKRWSAAITLQYLYQDQMLDVSTTEEVHAVKVKGHGLSARPSVRHDFEKRNWVELELGLTRQYLAAPLDDYWEGGPKLTLGHEYGHRSDLAAGYEFSDRQYDTRLPLDRQGRHLAGTSLNYFQHEIAVTSRHYWDQARRWRTTTKLAYKFIEDNGPGYFNYGRWQFSEQFRYRAKTWEVKTQFRVSRYRYPFQQLEETHFQKRQFTDLVATLRGEKNLAQSFKLYANYEYEQGLSNLALEQYAVNTISGGVDWEF